MNKVLYEGEDIQIKLENWEPRGQYIMKNLTSTYKWGDKKITHHFKYI